MMKRIEISKTTYDHLLAVAAEQGLAQSEINELADRTLRRAVGLPSSSTRSTEALTDSFREFRNTLQDTSLLDIFADRHRGLATGQRD